MAGRRGEAGAGEIEKSGACSPSPRRGAGDREAGRVRGYVIAEHRRPLTPAPRQGRMHPTLAMSEAETRQQPSLREEREIAAAITTDSQLLVAVQLAMLPPVALPDMAVPVTVPV